MNSKYNYIKDINKDNFIMGGLIYHHQVIIDPVERDKEFQKKVKEYIRNHNTDSEEETEYFDIEKTPISIENIFSLKAELENIKNQQSLSEMAMNKVMQYFGGDTEQHPFQEMYTADIVPSDNLWIKNGIKILDSDIIIFISHKGIAGSLYDHEIQEQKLCIRYSLDDNLGIYVGEVFDQNLIFGLLEYEEHMQEVLDMEEENNVE